MQVIVVLYAYSCISISSFSLSDLSNLVILIVSNFRCHLAQIKVITIQLNDWLIDTLAFIAVHARKCDNLFEFSCVNTLNVSQMAPHCVRAAVFIYYIYFGIYLKLVAGDNSALIVSTLSIG